MLSTTQAHESPLFSFAATPMLAKPIALAAQFDDARFDCVSVDALDW
jgi:hypothetical protein